MLIGPPQDAELSTQLVLLVLISEIVRPVAVNPLNVNIKMPKPPGFAEGAGVVVFFFSGIN